MLIFLCYGQKLPAHSPWLATHSYLNRITLTPLRMPYGKACREVFGEVLPTIAGPFHPIDFLFGLSMTPSSPASIPFLPILHFSAFPLLLASLIHRLSSTSLALIALPLQLLLSASSSICFSFVDHILHLHVKLS